MEKEIVMFTDGGSRGNPGPAAIGVYMSAQGGSALGGEITEWKYGECIGIKTNNDAEYEALIFGLKKLKQLLGKGRAKKGIFEGELEEGELVSCLECDGDFEVASVEPLKLTKVSDEEEADEDDE